MNLSERQRALLSIDKIEHENIKKDCDARNKGLFGDVCIAHIKPPLCRYYTCFKLGNTKLFNIDVLNDLSKTEDDICNEFQDFARLKEKSNKQ